MIARCVVLYPEVEFKLPWEPDPGDVVELDDGFYKIAEAEPHGEVIIVKLLGPTEQLEQAERL